MLQISTGLYFRGCVALNSHVHRQVFYTNRSFVPFDAVDFPVGRVLPSTTVMGVSAVMIEVVEHREALNEDGSHDFVLASGGTELLDDVAIVLSFVTNSLFSRDHDLVNRLVPEAGATPTARSKGRAANQLRGTLQNDRHLGPAEVDDARKFISKLVALRRTEYESAMRAIRRVVGAWLKIEDRPTAAYTDLVAALESLADKAQHVPAPTWENVDSRKRKIIDPTLAGLDEGTRTAIREAIIEAERAGARLRFTEFVLSHVSTEFYRDEAAGAVSPVRGPDLRRALDTAYAIRSNDVHALVDLPSEAWVMTGTAETVDVPALGRILTIEGLSRLARHVVRAFVNEAPVGVDYGFDWRDAVPGQMKMTLAPEYWLWQADGISASSAPLYLDGLLSHLLDLNAQGKSEIANLTGVVERIEQILPTLKVGLPGRKELVGIYALWHHSVALDLRRPDADDLLVKFSADLAAPSAVTFAVGLMSDALPSWTAEQYYDLAVARRKERERKKPKSPLPQGIEAALLFIAAEKCAEAAMPTQAAELASWAVEEFPGNSTLQTWEASRTPDGFSEVVDLRMLLFGVSDAASTADAGGPGDEAESADPTDGAEISGAVDTADAADAAGAAGGAGSPTAANMADEAVTANPELAGAAAVADEEGDALESSRTAAKTGAASGSVEQPSESSDARHADQSD